MSVKLKRIVLSISIGLMSLSAMPLVSLEAASTKSYKITDEEYNPYYEYVFVLDRQQEIMGVEELIKKDQDKLDKERIKKLRAIASAKSISDFPKLESEYAEANKKYKTKNKDLKASKKLIKEIEKQEKDIDKLVKKFISESSDDKLKDLHDELETKIKAVNKDMDKLEKDKHYKKYLDKYLKQKKKEEEELLKKVSK